MKYLFVGSGLVDIDGYEPLTGVVPVGSTDVDPF